MSEKETKITRKIVVQSIENIEAVKAELIALLTKYNCELISDDIIDIRCHTTKISYIDIDKKNIDNFIDEHLENNEFLF